MNKSLVVPLLLFSALCTLATWCGLYLNGFPFTWHFAFLLGYFTIVTLFLLQWQERRMSTDIKAFMRRFMGGLVMKLMGSLLVLFILLRIAPKDIFTPLSLAFAGLYLAYLAFSTGRLGRLLKKTHRGSA